MAVQERRTPAAAEDGLWDRCWTYSPAQAQLPAQVIFPFYTQAHIKNHFQKNNFNKTFILLFNMKTKYKHTWVQLEVP